jgi:hypothetical protein
MTEREHCEGLHLFQIDDGADTLVIARDPDDAWLVLKEWCDMTPEDVADGDAGPPPWEQIADDKVVPLLAEEESDLPAGATEAPLGHWRFEMTAAEWCKRDGRGFFGSLEW